MLDLLAVPQGEHWARLEGAMRRLDDERGRPWRLKLLLPDTPEAATARPRLVARLGDAGMTHDSGRAPGGAQLLVVARRSARAQEPTPPGPTPPGPTPPGPTPPGPTPPGPTPPEPRPVAA